MEVREETEKKAENKCAGTLLKFLKITFLSIAGCIVLLLLLTWIFEDKIKQYAIERLNQNLTAPVKVEEINLSFFAKFPYASLEFTNVLIEDPDSLGREKDTLIAAEKIFLEFSIWDLLSGKYEVKNIEASNAYIDLFTDKKGNQNFHIWKESSDTVPSRFDFNLREITFDNTSLNYSNRQTKQEFAFDIQNMKMTGHFTEKEFDLEIQTNCKIKNIINRNIPLLNDKQSFADFDLHIDKNNSLYSVNKGTFKIGDLNFDLSGSIGEKDPGAELDLKMKGKNISIESLVRTFPWLLGEDISAYQTSGELQFESTVQGNSGSPEINALFSIADANLSEKESGVSLKNLRFEGRFDSSNEKGEEELYLKNVSGIFSEGKFNGDIFLTNLDKPRVRGNVNGQFNLNALQQFFRFNLIDKASGNIAVKANLEADFLYDESEGAWGMKIKKNAGSANLKNISLKMHDLHVPYNDFSGVISLKNDHATVEDLHGLLGKTDVVLNGILSNLLPYLLFENKKLNIVADLYSRKADLDDMFGGGTKTDTATSRLRFPADINFNLDTHIDELVLGTFTARDISGNFKMIDQQFEGKKLKMNFAGGKCEGSLEIDGRSADLFGINSSLTIQDMKIKELFSAFENFGQKEILPENINGSISSEIIFGTVMDSRLTIQQDKIYSKAKITIKEGELINLKTLTGISEFLQTDKLTKVLLRKHINDISNRLEHVKFAELSNELTIQNGKVYIPRMDVKSSALDIRMSGDHGFNDSIHYEFDFRFRDLKMDESETEYGTIVDDGTGMRIYIQMTGTIDHPVYSTDAERRKEDRKEYNKNEISNTKAILQNEFGLFKKDTTLKMKETPKEDVKFLYEWDEEKKEEKTPQDPAVKKQQDNKKRMDKLKNRLGIEENQKQGFEIEQ